MTQPPPSPRLLVLTGGSGTGKTTLAVALQERLLPEPWLRFSVDTLLYGLPPSQVEPADRRNDWSRVDGPALRGDVWACLRALLTRGRPLLFDCVVSSERGARELRAELAELDAVVVGLSCSLEETRRRTLARGDRSLEEAELGHAVGDRLFEPDLRLDTTGRSPGELAGDVLAFLAANGPETRERHRRARIADRSGERP